MTNTDTEALRKVAEIIGWATWTSPSGKLWFNVGEYLREWQEADINNPAQLVEMEDWLLKRDLRLLMDDGYYFWQKWSEGYDLIVMSTHHESRAQAALNAIKEMGDE